MMRMLAAAASMLLWTGAPACAHRLDQYLQATKLRVDKDRVQAQLHLTPGVAVFPTVIAEVDTDSDGTISFTEQRAYAERVLRDLSLTMDGKPLRLRLVSTTFADLEEFKQGRGSIAVEFIADVPRSGGPRTLIYENHHNAPFAAYLVNCLVPRDPDIRIAAQKRNYQQSRYELNYTQAGTPQAPLWVATAALLVLARLALVWRPARTRWVRRPDSD